MMSFFAISNKGRIKLYAKLSGRMGLREKESISCSYVSQSGLEFFVQLLAQHFRKAYALV